MELELEWELEWEWELGLGFQKQWQIQWQYQWAVGDGEANCNFKDGGEASEVVIGSRISYNLYILKLIINIFYDKNIIPQPLGSFKK